MSPSSKNPRRPTIKDVAAVAGVHFTTVSLALRRHPSIPETTRERIRLAAEQIGYEPNPVFAALTRFHTEGRVRGTPPRIAFVVNRWVDESDTTFAHQQALWEGAQRQAATLGYTLDRINVGDDNHDSRTVEKHLRSQSISGLIIANFEPGYASLSLKWQDYAIVKINSMHMAPDAALVSNDHLQEVRLAFRRLRSLGYRRVGLAINRSAEEATNHRLTAGYLVEEAAVPSAERVPPLVFQLNAPFSSITQSVARWVRNQRIDAVLCSWPNIDELLAAARIRVPDEVACASLSVVDPASQVAGVRPNLSMVGIKAVSLVAAQLKTGERGIPEFASTTYVRSSWQDGTSAPANN